MPAVIPFIPLIAAGVSTAVGAGVAHHAATVAKNQNAPLIAAQTALARQQAAIAKLAGPALTETSDYYRTLLHGNKAALNTALAPEISSITELSRGAERGLDRGPAGPQRDMARAELGRDTAAHIGSLFPAARRAGAEGLANVGSLAMGGAGNAAGIFQNLLNGQRLDTQARNNRMDALGEGVGPLLVDFYKAWQSRGSGAGRSAPTWNPPPVNNNPTIPGLTPFTGFGGPR